MIVLRTPDFTIVRINNFHVYDQLNTKVQIKRCLLLTLQGTPWLLIR